MSLLDDLPSMALFAEVVRLRSFSEAARQTGIAKSAVSRRIRELEERLSVRLLTRTTRKLSLTTDGLRYYEHCAQLLRTAALADESVSLSSSSARGRVRINAPVTFSQLYLARALAEFLRVQPEIELELSADDRLVDVVEGGFDLVIRVTRPADSQLVARKLASTRLVVCGAPGYLAAAGVPQTPEELVHHNCLHYSLVSRAAEWRFRGEHGVYAIPIRSNFSSSDGTVLREAARAGLGLAVLPLFMVLSDLKSGALQTVLDQRRRARIGIFAMYAERRHMPLRTRLLLDFLCEHFRDADWESAPPDR